METKIYFANNVPAALDTARRELGPDALLLNSRPAPPEMRHLGKLEVTFAFEAPRAFAAPAAQGTSRVAAIRQSPSELEDIRRQIAAIRESLERPGSQVTHSSPDWIAERLTAAGLDDDLSREVSAAAEVIRPSDPGSAVEEVLEGRIRTSAFEQLKPGETRIVAFAGPGGRGKTSTLVKTAFQFGIAQRVPVRIYTAGPHAVGAQEQMARYAAILGVPWQAHESLATLHLALNGERWKGLVLIDTPALGVRDSEEIARWGHFLARRREIQTHLVLRSDARSADMNNVVTCFAGFEPAALLFTGLDETQDIGAAASTLIRTGMKAMLTGTGPRIPEDLGQADANEWIAGLWEIKAAAAAA